MIENFVKTIGGYGSDNNNLVLTRFLLHYLKSSSAANYNQIQLTSNSKSHYDYGGLADSCSWCDEFDDGQKVLEFIYL